MGTVAPSETRPGGRCHTDRVPELDGCAIKLARAEGHVQELESEIKGQFDGKYTFAVDRGSDGRYLYRVENLPGIPKRWSAIVGDALFNIRSALDHLAWQLVLLEGKKPTRRTQFPILVTQPQDERGRQTPVNVIPALERQDVIDELHRVQPFSEVGPGDNAAQTPLARLAALNNIDKHRLLLTTAGALDANEMYWGLPEGVASPKFAVMNGPAENGTVVALFMFNGGSDAPEGFDPHPAMHVVINEPEFPDLLIVPVTRVLGAMCSRVKWMVEYEFGRFF